MEDSQNYIPPEESSFPWLKIVVGVITILVVVATIYGGWYFFGDWVKNKIGSIQQEAAVIELPENIGLNETSAKPEDVAGLILFSANTSADQLVKTYSINFNREDNRLTNESSYFGVLSSSFVEFENILDPSAFFAKLLTVSTSTEGDRTANNTLYHVSLPDSLIEVNSDSSQQFGTLSYSDTTGSLAYMSFRGGRGDTPVSFSSPEIADWSIFIDDSNYSNDEVLAIIDGAVHPVWMPDGVKLLYVKADGIYFYDMAVGLEQQVLQFSPREAAGKLTAATMLDVSEDGQYLILTLEGLGNIEVYKITPEPFTLDLEGRIVNPNTTYSWPLIAPDGKTYAVLAKDIVDNGFDNPRIEVRSVMGRKILVSYPLGDFTSGTILLDDWIANELSY